MNKTEETILGILLLIIVVLMTAQQGIYALTNETTTESIHFKVTMVLAFQLPELTLIAIMFVIAVFGFDKDLNKNITVRQKGLNEAMQILKRSLELQTSVVLNLLDFIERPKGKGIEQCIEDIKNIKRSLDHQNEKLLTVLHDLGIEA